MENHNDVRDAELRDYGQFDRRNDSGEESVESLDSDYSPAEIEKNRFWNVFFTLAALTGIWVMFGVQTVPLGGAIALSVIVLICSWLYRWLFASTAGAKLHESSAGSGKRVGPITMGTILGYLNDGFKW